MNRLTRRTFLAAAAAMPVAASTSIAASTSARIVVIGGGFGGASVARYLRRHDPTLSVTLVERERLFVTCPFSNGVLGGLWPLSKLTFDYRKVAAAGVKVVHDSAASIDPGARKVTLAQGGTLAYDYLVLSPGVQFVWNAVQGYDERASQVMPHAWQAGVQTTLLRQQLEAMADGGLVIIGVPPAPFRCPPGPYERACLIAYYLKQHKPRSKLLILDSNDSFSKQGLFTEAWTRLYPGMVEWVPGSQSGRIISVNPATMTVSTGFDDHKAAVVNIIPPQRAGEIAIAAGLDRGHGFCAVDPATFESQVAKRVYVLGDAAIAGEMPKSGFAANCQAKACGAAILAEITGRTAPLPRLVNTCYSLAAPDYGFSIGDVFEIKNATIGVTFQDGRTTRLKAPDDVLKREAAYAESWYANITADMFG